MAGYTFVLWVAHTMYLEDRGIFWFFGFGLGWLIFTILAHSDDFYR